MVSEKDYVDARIDGVRSDLSASIAELRAEVKGLAAKIEALPTTWTLVGTVTGGFAVSLSLLFTFLSYSGDRAESARTQQMQIDRIAAITENSSVLIEQTSRRMDDISAKLDRTAGLSEQNARHISEISERLDRSAGDRQR